MNPIEEAVPPHLYRQQQVIIYLDQHYVDLNAGKVHDLVMAEIELPLLHAVMSYCAGNQSTAAAILGLNRATLRKKFSRYKITPRDYKR